MNRGLHELLLLAAIGCGTLLPAARAATPPSTVFINEWLASNTNGLVDPADGQHDDWFELYNLGTNALDLSGYFLTDSLSNKFKFMIPAGYAVPSRDFLLVWADNQPDQNTASSPDLHVNFTLDGGDGDEDEEVAGGGGGEIGLFAPEGTAVDVITFGHQHPDVSEGRWPDGATNRYLMTHPTPRTSNTLAPIITQQPLGFVVDTNGSADFSVQAYGTPPFGYQWYFWAREAADFRALPDQTNQTLALMQVQASDYGSYLVAISNVAGSGRSGIGDLAQTAKTCMFINNSFETDSWSPASPFDPPVSGWNYQANNGYGWGLQSGGGIIGGNLIVLGNAPDGKQFFDLDGGDCARTIAGHPDCGHASIDQTVNGFTIGNQYKLSFWIASEHLLSCSLDLTLTGGNPLGTTTFTAPPRLAVDWDNWVQRTLDFTATASSVNFKFQHTGNTLTLNYIGIGLDKICVEPACTDTPVITCPPSLVVSCESGGGPVVVNYLSPMVTTGCGTTITNLTCLPLPGSLFPPGTTTVICTAKNNLGKMASCSFTVTVIPDTTPPVIDCSCLISHAHNLLLTNACQAAVPNLCQFAACFSDNCCLSSCSQSPAAGTILGLGTHPITVTIADCAGNTNSCGVNFVVVTPEQGCGPCSCPTNNLIVNGSFEAGTFPGGCQSLPLGSVTMPGWTVITDEISRCSVNNPPYNVPASEGALFLDLTGSSDAPPHGGVTQTVPTTANQCYRLTFDLGVNLDFPILAGPITVKVTAGTATMFFTHNPSGTGTVWSSYGFVFTAPGPNTPITFQGISGLGFIGLDNVSLVCTCDCTNTCPPSCPPTTMTVSGCPPLMPDFSTNSFAGSNCYPAGPLSVTQNIPPGTPLPPGQTVVILQVCDALGHCRDCDVTITATNSPGCHPCPCSTNNLIANGSFEAGTFPGGCQLLPLGSIAMPGWTVNGDEIARCSLNNPPYNVPASDGALFLDLTGYTDAPPHGGVTQTAPTTSGQCYRLTFDLGVNLDFPILAGPITVKVTAGATTIFFTHNPAGTGTVWSSYGFVFTAAGPNTPITFEGITGLGFIGLDNVALVCTCDCTNTCLPSCPPTTMTVSGCPPLMPDFTTNSFAGSNCYPTGPLSITQNIPPGTPLPLGPTVVIIHVCDALGHCRDCDVTITGVASPGCCTVTPVLNLFSGHNANGPLPGGALDPQFTTGAPLFTGPNPYVQASPDPAWVPNTPTSGWIGPAPGNPEVPAGVYIYTNRFFLCSTSQAAITGRWTADNSGEIRLNGAPTGNLLPPTYAFTNWHPVNITSGFVLGWNTLTFLVTNDSFFGFPTVTGLRTEITGSACCSGCMTISCPANIGVQSCTAAPVSYPTPSGTANCGGTLTITCSPPSGAMFPPGVTTVSCTASDGLGHAAGCTFTVSVLPPVIPCWPLGIALSNNTVVLSWPEEAAGFGLQHALELHGTDTIWNMITNSPTTVKGKKQVQLQRQNPSGFFRLIWTQ